MTMRRLRALIIGGAVFVGVPTFGALADYVYTDVNGQHVVFSFVCQSTKLCTAFVLADSTGVEKGTATNPLTTVPSSQYPKGATPLTASATGTTAATTATLAATSGITDYICGFSIRANATSVATGNATVTGTITGTLNFTQWTAPNAAGLGVTEMIFAPCVPAIATNTPIAVVSAAAGAGGIVSVTAWGYQL